MVLTLLGMPWNSENVMVDESGNEVEYLYYEWNVTIGKNITTIGAGAFEGCNNLKEIVINSKLLKAKNLSPEAFEGLRKDVVFYVPAKKLKAYTTMFRKLGVKA